MIKRLSSLLFACLLAFAFPLSVLLGVPYYQDDSQEQESVIGFDEPVFEIVFPIEPNCYRNPVESEQSEPSLESDTQECDVVNSIENEQDVEEQYGTEEYDDPDNNFDFEYYDNEDVVFDEIEEDTDKYDYGYDNEELFATSLTDSRLMEVA